MVREPPRPGASLSPALLSSCPSRHPAPAIQNAELQASFVSCLPSRLPLSAVLLVDVKYSYSLSRVSASPNALGNLSWWLLPAFVLHSKLDHVKL